MKRYFHLLNMIFITVILFFGVKIFYLWVTKDLYVLPAQAEYSETEEVAEKSPPPLSAYQNILERNLFKATRKNASDPGATSVSAGDLQPAPLSLKLWGTATFESGQGFAVIEDVPSKRQELFTKGQKIQNATLKIILRDKVILNIDGKEKVLKMEDPQNLPERIQPIPAPATRGPSKQIALSRSQIDDAIQNINELMTQIKIRPHFLDGKPDGLAVGGILPDSIFSKMGLQNGDIIMGVNGEKILSVDDALKLYQSIKSGSNVTVSLKRAGKPETLMYQID